MATSGIARIVFTGDVLRPGEAGFRPAQTENILWFHRLVRLQARAATGLPVEVVAWGRGIDTERLYELWDAEKSWRGWARIFDSAFAPDGVLAEMERAFGGAVVIGFELAESMKRILSLLGIPFIDFGIHPVRFLEDVFFAVQTNDAAVFDEMLADHAEESAFIGAAGLLAASALKFRPELRINGETLLIGQTRIDRSLVRGGRIVNLSDFTAELNAATGDGAVVFKPHPYANSDFGALSAGLSLRRMQLTYENVYALMASEDIRRVVGVSSSVLIEARYFGQEARFLHESPFDIPARRVEAVPGQHLSVVDAWADADFWRRVLAPLVPVTRPDGERFRRPPNALRTSLRNFWGFNELSTDFQVGIARAGRASPAPA
ncbi:hypothetical protein J8J14_04540 [Roseomonas sp. SSH11]|uniref:Uncharacterized protein n=1 Tax=Pararoseomonas baculiformis TaxID=2820812 RepID=A0ABS4AC12_9PROT|nr:hypothetical protein [Pararoseomonas baculiformis]MBP0444038.1 hypothetical protein [Pararoseomonas baculiformis]